MENTRTSPALQTAPSDRPRPPRFITAASLFDGHDAAINIIRRMLVASGAEVIHLGHNRSVREVVDTAIQEDADAIAVSSYQGGHMEYFRYMVDSLREYGAGHIRVFGGGGGVIVPAEIEELHRYGVSRIFSAEDGMALGLQGMIDEMLAMTRNAGEASNGQKESAPEPYGEWLKLARSLSAVERKSGSGVDGGAGAPVIGITGTGGAGKSTLLDELVRRFLRHHPSLRIALLSVDPTRRRTGGALLGDRIRMNALYGAYADRVYMRSFATRQAHRSVSEALHESIARCRAAGYGLIFVETAGIGQSDTEIADLADLSLYVMTGDFGAPTQLEKIGMLDAADLVALNKFEKRGSADALHEIRKQIVRNRGWWDRSEEEMPVYPTMASHFNDPGVTALYEGLAALLGDCCGFARPALPDGGAAPMAAASFPSVIPANRERYLAEIADAVRRYRKVVESNVHHARSWGAAMQLLQEIDDPAIREPLETLAEDHLIRLEPGARTVLEQWEERAAAYTGETFTYTVRGRDIQTPLRRETLSGSLVPRVAFPAIDDAGERVRFGMLENLPGHFPYTAGVFPFKRDTEDPTRMFAGEGSPERTNRRFHLLSSDLPARRLSTAFDSVTLYGFDPDERPDIFGKIGNAGVSIATLDDMKKLYSGFDLCHPATSVSMTINGPAPMILAVFLNTAIDQQVEFYLRAEGRWEETARRIEAERAEEPVRYVPFGPDGRTESLPAGHDGSGLGMLGVSGSDLVRWGLLDADEYERIRKESLQAVRGTVQADILKEDQAQNTCIFSTEFALRLMGDVQQYFIDNDVRNYYSVSVSGYHIAEAGANPITQLALTLANGFTYVEYYLSRGMAIDDFAPNLSFFFSNGMDAEYSVLGRVARRIWAIAMRDRYGASERSRKLKYHIQTSGRSLHAREISFNDIRTTLQALTATYDHCNSLHTNAFDEAITTPTEESVRRALAIQLIINREFGPAQCENPLQGSYFIRELTDLVEAAVLDLFDQINERGGVLGAMETRFQRHRIQDESMLYEQKKHSGELPLVGVNTFLRADLQAEEGTPVALMRSSEEEKRHQIQHLRRFHAVHREEAGPALDRLARAARSGEPLFEELMETVRVCSLGQITRTLFEVGGQYRRTM